MTHFASLSPSLFMNQIMGGSTPFWYILGLLVALTTIAFVSYILWIRKRDCL